MSDRRKRKRICTLVKKEGGFFSEHIVIDLYAELRSFARSVLHEAEVDPDRVVPVYEYLGITPRQLKLLRTHLEEDPFGD